MTLSVQPWSKVFITLHAHSVRDPLLRAIDYPVLAIFCLLRCGLQALHVAASECLGNRQRDELLA